MTSPTRIHITGASGSGTTTLGRALAERMGLPFYDTDDFYWMPSVPLFQTKRTPAERNAALERELAPGKRFVSSGSVMLWGTSIEHTFDLVVFLLIPPDIRMARLIARETERFGAPDPEFIEWAATYETAETSTRSLRLHEEWLAQQTCPILRLEGDLTTAEQIDAILSHGARNSRAL